MDLSRFSLIDFLGYFFPGIASALGIYLILLLTPLKEGLESIDLGFAAGLVFAAMGYILGIILSGFSRSIVGLIWYITKFKPPREAIQLLDFEEDIAIAFQKVFNKRKVKTESWSYSKFLLCRAMVAEYMPNMMRMAERQDALFIMRRNMISAILIWMTVGIVWGLSYISKGSPSWGVTLLVTSVMLSILILWSTMERMQASYKREVRFIITGFLSGYKTGRFKKNRKRKNRV